MMVKQIISGDKRIYQCEDCKLFYNNEKWAKKCQDWCRNNNSCNIEITKHRMKGGK